MLDSLTLLRVLLSTQSHSEIILKPTKASETAQQCSYLHPVAGAAPLALQGGECVQPWICWLLTMLCTMGWLETMLQLLRDMEWVSWFRGVPCLYPCYSRLGWIGLGAIWDSGPWQEVERDEFEGPFQLKPF